MGDFSEGQSVFLYTHAGGMVRKTIRKQYKTGNYVLEGSPEQYGRGGFSRGQWSRAHIVPVTEKTQAEYNFRVLKNKLKRQYNRLSRFEFDQSDYALMAEIEDFLRLKIPVQDQSQ